MLFCDRLGRPICLHCRGVMQREISKEDGVIVRATFVCRGCDDRFVLPVNAGMVAESG